MRTRVFHSGVLTALLAAAPAVRAQQLPPIHPLGAVVHSSTELLGAVSAARQLPGGHVLVNDISGRKLVLFDSTLASFSIVADTTSATANAYSSRAGGLIPFRGDSTLFVDPTSLSMLVIDGAGKVARVMSVPRPNDAVALIGGPSGTPAFDGQGRLVYRAPPQFRVTPPPAGAGGGGAPAIGMPQFPDSSPIVRIDLESRKLDTVAFVKIPKQNLNVTQDANGRMSITSTINPMPQADDWAVLHDGSVAIVRGSDYHIDWVRPDGARSSSAKIPFAWRRLSDEDKVAFIDSAKTAMEKLRSTFNAGRPSGPAGGPVVAPPDGGGGVSGSVQIFTREERGRAGGGDGARPAAPAGGGPANFQLPPLQFVAPSELPDYAPPFTAGAARGDLDGNIWIRTSNVVAGGSVYDMVNAKGELIDRVQLPAGRVIAGFGQGGVVFMGVRDGAGVRLEMARVK
jgi:hypothetical protein